MIRPIYEKNGGNDMMDQLVIGILAHVDAGKTTLTEAMLYTSGQLRKLGRVDHGDAFLDTDEQERRRGITIFSKQALLPLPTAEVTILDTPGHVDFSGEMERTLQVLDCAVLVVSAAAGVQAHTLTVWRLLRQWGIPVFLFVNKMDAPGVDRAALLAQLREKLDGGCVDFSAGEESLWEEAATGSEAALGEYLDTGRLSRDTLRRLIARREIFPCWFGSALKLQGVEEFLGGLEEYAPRPAYPAEFSARVFKISRDGQGQRLTFLKVTGGVLHVKDVLTGTSAGEAWEEKADQLRRYSGEKFKSLEEAPAGTVCAVTGLTRTFPGQGLGAAEDAPPPSLTPALSYRLYLPEEADPALAMGKLRQLEEEDPLLRLLWNERLREIHVQLMGEIQLEILRELIERRFGWAVTFGAGSIVYRETIANTVEGVGHYEPLRHYAEVRLLLEPGERGSGLTFRSLCPEDDLDRSWQRLILTHLMEKPHLGVLTGSPITDMRITLTAGRGHLKHTEGGDFRQATYRAVRQGLMEAESVLLEPWYDFRLEVPAAHLGRAMGDIQQMGGSFDPAETAGESALITGSAPVAGLTGYGREVAAYTKGLGRLSLSPGGYRPCHNQEEVVAALGYDPERDLDNPADSVFCAHGAGYTVKWRDVPAAAHTPSFFKEREAEAAEEAPRRRSAPPPPSSREEEAALQAIFERTYGPVKRRLPMESPPKAPRTEGAQRRTVPPRRQGPEYLLVDGYNVIFAWEELKEMAGRNLEAARHMLMDILCNYQGFKKCVVILVFDAYKVKGNPGSVERYKNIHVVYTKEAETADTYIERATYEIAKENRVRVATSDNLEQLIILGHGAVRLAAADLKTEVEAAEGRIAEIIERSNRAHKGFNTLRDRAVITGGEK